MPMPTPITVHSRCPWYIDNAHRLIILRPKCPPHSQVAGGLCWMPRSAQVNPGGKSKQPARSSAGSSSEVAAPGSGRAASPGGSVRVASTLPDLRQHTPELSLSTSCSSSSFAPLPMPMMSPRRRCQEIARHFLVQSVAVCLAVGASARRQACFAALMAALMACDASQLIAAAATARWCGGCALLGSLREPLSLSFSFFLSFSHPLSLLLSLSFALASALSLCGSRTGWKRQGKGQGECHLQQVTQGRLSRR